MLNIYIYFKTILRICFHFFMILFFLFFSSPLDRYRSLSTFPFFISSKIEFRIGKVSNSKASIIKVSINDFCVVYPGRRLISSSNGYHFSSMVIITFLCI